MADQRKCENDSVPALRFEGFSDPWEQRRLGELYEKAGRKNSGEYGGESIISVANMRFSPADRELAEGYLKEIAASISPTADLLKMILDQALCLMCSMFSARKPSTILLIGNTPSTMSE